MISARITNWTYRGAVAFTYLRSEHPGESFGGEQMDDASD